MVNLELSPVTVKTTKITFFVKLVDKLKYCIFTGMSVVGNLKVELQFVCVTLSILDVSQSSIFGHGASDDVDGGLSDCGAAGGRDVTPGRAS